MPVYSASARVVLRPFCANGDQHIGQATACGALSGKTKIAFVIRV
jgi:hypothetical protein